MMLKRICRREAVQTIDQPMIIQEPSCRPIASGR
jgi:hypothetical protein